MTVAGRARVGGERGADEAQGAGARASAPQSTSRPPAPRRLVHAERAARARNVAAPEQGAGAEGAGTQRRLKAEQRARAAGDPGGAEPLRGAACGGACVCREAGGEGECRREGAEAGAGGECDADDHACATEEGCYAFLVRVLARHGAAAQRRRQTALRDHRRRARILAWGALSPRRVLVAAAPPGGGARALPVAAGRSRRQRWRSPGCVRSFGGGGGARALVAGCTWSAGARCVAVKRDRH